MVFREYLIIFPKQIYIYIYIYINVHLSNFSPCIVSRLWNNTIAQFPLLSLYKRHMGFIKKKIKKKKKRHMGTSISVMQYNK